MRMICGTDFTDSARRAATVAATLATRSEDMLLLLHSLEGGGAGALSGELHDSLCAITNEQWQTEAERLRGLGATVKAELLAGWPDTAIVQKALPASTRLIVVSARSEEAPRTPGLGSGALRRQRDLYGNPRMLALLGGTERVSNASGHEPQRASPGGRAC